jgi:hypothetical protein
MIPHKTIAHIGGIYNLDLIVCQKREGLLLPAAASSVALTAMLALAFAETSGSADKIDSMLSGTDLAVSRMTEWLRRLIWIDLIGALFLPVGMAAADNGPLAWLIGLAYWGVKLAAFILGLSAIQTTLGRTPRHSLPNLLGAAALLALLATIMVLASTGNA